MRMLGRDAVRTRVILVGGGALLLVFLLVVTAFAATGRHGPEGAVEEAMESYLDAGRDGGLAAVKEHLCARRRQEIIPTPDVPGAPVQITLIRSDPGAGSPKIIDIQVSGGTAQVFVEFDGREDGPRKTRTVTFRMVQEEGSWRVC